ncbi:hypothetical protein PCASD_15320 [Puccinia coronata f. sp. avenae]|uniref:Hydrophobin n=1 Tax=Puccinia coronata f. sp. avenae TaxID=200324 RepID=A0A2N5UB77_9BASI|nr:hypothetical protein PCASD_15320 [Puccinia coronata f. sp. avenae]
MQFLQSILFLACATAFVEVLACSGDRPVAWCVSRFADKNGVTTGWTIDPKKAGSTCQQQQYASTTCCTSSFKPDRKYLDSLVPQVLYTPSREKKSLSPTRPRARGTPQHITPGNSTSPDHPSSPQVRPAARRT